MITSRTLSSLNWIAPNYQSRQDAKSVMHLLRSAMRKPRNGNPNHHTSMHHTNVWMHCYNLMVVGIPIRNTSPRIISLRFYFQEVSEAFGWTRNNSECFIFYPQKSHRPPLKYNPMFDCKGTNKWGQYKTNKRFFCYIFRLKYLFLVFYVSYW